MTTPEIEYNANFPLVKDSYGSWQPQFKDNFTQLSRAFAVNHVPLEAASSAGNHTIIQLLEQQSSQQTGVSEFSIYSKAVQYADQETDQIFMRFQGNGTEFQFTNYQIYPLSQVDTYFTFLPGKIICFFGIFDYATAPNGALLPGGIQLKRLNLLPAISRNIMSVNFTNIANPGGATPSFDLIMQNQFIIALQPRSIRNLYYMVLANV